MKRSTLWLILGALALLAAGTGVVVVMSDWKKRAQLTAGTDTFNYLMGLLNGAEDQYGIPRDLLARQAYQESHFRPDIISGATVSPAGALGLMQIVPAYHPTADPLNVPAAIQYAASFMRSLYNQFGTWSLALAAYNAGPGNVAKYGNTVPPFAETQAYVSGILSDVNDERAQTGGGMLA